MYRTTLRRVKLDVSLALLFLKQGCIRFQSQLSRRVFKSERRCCTLPFIPPFCYEKPPAELYPAPQRLFGAEAHLDGNHWGSPSPFLFFSFEGKHRYRKTQNTKRGGERIENKANSCAPHVLRKEANGKGINVTAQRHMFPGQQRTAATGNRGKFLGTKQIRIYYSITRLNSNKEQCTVLDAVSFSEIRNVTCAKTNKCW